MGENTYIFCKNSVKDSDLGRGWKIQIRDGKIQIRDKPWIQNHTITTKTKFEKAVYQSGSEPGPLLIEFSGSGRVNICTDPDPTLFFSFLFRLYGKMLYNIRKEAVHWQNEKVAILAEHQETTKRKRNMQQEG